MAKEPKAHFERGEPTGLKWQARPVILELSYVFFYILVGYWCVSRTHTRKLSLLSRPNYVIFYESAIWGGGIFVVSLIVGMSIKVRWYGCDFLQVATFSRCGSFEATPYPFMLEVVFAVVLAVSISLFQNALADRRKALETASRASGEIPSLILDALNRKFLLEVTLRSRKVYVGWILRGPGIANDGAMVDVAISPLSSGYRDSMTLAVVLTTDFEPSYRNEQLSEDSIEVTHLIDDQLDQYGRDTSVLIPLSEIVAIRPFNVEINPLEQTN